MSDDSIITLIDHYLTLVKSTNLTTVLVDEVRDWLLDLRNLAQLDITITNIALEANFNDSQD
jgi:hypothetical protein